jgi:energy-coupling factor transporter ATP-binding protein EcfA2
MLRTLTIRDFVIVDTIELEFSNGFTVLTGETGAGKSILIDALQLALGGRGDASMVREGAAKADISADFILTPAASRWLEQNEFALEDGGALLRRVVDNAGRSKAYINGSGAPPASCASWASCWSTSTASTRTSRCSRGTPSARCSITRWRCATPPRRPRCRTWRPPIKPGARSRASARNTRPTPRTCCWNASASNGR